MPNQPDTIKMSVNQCIDEYHQNNQKIKELEKYNDLLKTKMTEYFSSRQQSSYQNDHYNLKLVSMSRDIVPAKKLPPDIFNKYRETITYNRLMISKIKKK